MAGYKLPQIASAAQLREFLRAELGYCTCAFADTVPLLKDVLRMAKVRSDSLEDMEAHKRIWHALEDRLLVKLAPALANWFVYTLDRADLVHHNYNVLDIWIMDRGRLVLDALDRFPDPALLEDDEQASGHQSTDKTSPPCN